MPKDLLTLETENTTLAASVVTLTSARDTALGQVSALTTENTTLKADKGTLTTQLGTANANLSTVTAERDMLKTENATLKANQDTAIAAGVATKLTALGISNTGAKKEEGEKAKKLTVTEKLLASKGVTTIAELDAKKLAAK
ncbi:MAG: hypothetical protein JWM68_239 [Verrucomicrobiales bacterium]|nr:hypothetical protein [Verrucomicrobiales bacterium]